MTAVVNQCQPVRPFFRREGHFMRTAGVAGVLLIREPTEHRRAAAGLCKKQQTRKKRLLSPVTKSLHIKRSA